MNPTPSPLYTWCVIAWGLGNDSGSDVFDGNESEGNEPEKTQDCIRNYLIANSEIIERALDAYRAMPESQRAEMKDQHSELDYSAVSPSFDSLAANPLINAKAGVSVRAGWKISNDDLHLLDRALEYAKYVTDTSSMELGMQPIEASLPR